MEDPRKSALKRGLRQLQVEDVRRLVDHVEAGNPVLLDRDEAGAANYSGGTFCPLAVAFGLPGLYAKLGREPSDEDVRDMLWGAGLRIYNTRGVEGTFYREHRREDLLTAAREVLVEKASGT